MDSQENLRIHRILVVTNLQKHKKHPKIRDLQEKEGNWKNLELCTSFKIDSSRVTSWVKSTTLTISLKSSPMKSVHT